MGKRISPIRVVIDTNLWVSFLITGNYRQLDRIVTSNRITILFSHELLEELDGTFNKPKLAKHFSSDALERMLRTFDPYITLVSVRSSVQTCRDPKDDFLLALAQDGKADILVTGDRDLLVLGHFGRTHIMTIREFLERKL